MILPDFVLPSRVNQCWEYSGIDSYEHCNNKNHFKNYPHKITYQYNSRGFRDQEWPNTIDELKAAIWCVGDSFTVGLGSPLEHTWPWLLQKQTGQRAINVSMDGASNNWISRKTVDILQQINPSCIVIHWSYPNRREHPDLTWTDEERRIHYSLDDLELDKTLDNFYHCVNNVEQNKGNCKILHSMIPHSYPGITDAEMQKYWAELRGPDWPALPDFVEDIPAEIVNELKTVHQCWDYCKDYYNTKDFFRKMMSGADCIGWVETHDKARDGFHYDILTSQWFVNRIINWLNNSATQ